MSKVKVFKRDFQEVVIGLSSPEGILARSSGEITEAETKNHRTYKSEEGGLFCQRIFGPEEDWKCSCGKYTGIKYRGNVCDRCGVEVNERRVRRERMGHIRLAVPIVHTWFFRYNPNIIATLLGVSAKKLESVIYYSSYVVIQPGTKKKRELSYLDFLSPKEYHKHLDSLPKNHLLPDSNPSKFIAKMGGKAIHLLLKGLDLDALARELRDAIENETSKQRQAEAIKRLGVVESFRSSVKRGMQNKPEWMVLEYLPVMSPEFRPILMLKNGRPVTSDATELLKKIIMRNNRLRKLVDMGAPEVILLNEQRMLQEGVDAFIDNSPRMNTVTSESGRPYKSIGDGLKGKSGLLRSNLLGKRVDYSGRSVITVGPHLKLHECGLPKTMALILFGPLVIQRLKLRGIVKTFKQGRKFLETKSPEVWQVLEAVIDNHPVLLNRAPTLHRLGIQAFYPKLTEGKSIQLHPLVCTAFNADFDGDQMAVHVPLSQEAIAEARFLLLSSRNLLKPSNGEPIALPSKEMLLGLYYSTKGARGTSDNPVKGEGMSFSSLEEVLVAFHNQKISKHAHIKFLLKKEGGKEEIIETTVGRVLLNEYIPKEVGFVNMRIDSRNIRGIVKEIYQKKGMAFTASFLDLLKDFGFQQAYEGGLTFGLDDMKTPAKKEQMLKASEEKVAEIKRNYQLGLITRNERYNQTIDEWSKLIIEMKAEILRLFAEDGSGFNSPFMMVDSGSRGSHDQLNQFSGVRGLMTKPQKQSNDQQNIIEYPICSSIMQGVLVLEFFISTHGARKGLADTTLKTADAGYLTRKLIEAAGKEVISGEDCKTLRGRIIRPVYKRGQIKETLGKQIIGRVTAEVVINPQDKSILIERNTEITETIAEKIDQLGIPFVKVRCVVYCELSHGACRLCYGVDLSTQQMCMIGDSIGVIGAQSLSEEATQLTLRTFHTGGAFAGSLVEDTIKAFEDGIVELTGLRTVVFEGKTVVTNRSASIKVIGAKAKQEIQSHILPYGCTLLVEEGERVKAGQVLFEWDLYRIPILTTISGRVIFDSIEEGLTYKEDYNEQTGQKGRIIIDSQDKEKVPSIIVDNGKGERATYVLPAKAQINVEEGDIVEAGSILAKITRPKNTPKDIVGGLPHVSKLLEMQTSMNRAVVASTNGHISIGARKRGKLELFITASDEKVTKYKIPLNKQLLVHDGDYVQAGDLLSDGLLSAEDVLEVKGLGAFCDHMIREIQSVYQLQGIYVNNKHLEVILRQMLHKVEIVSAGDTDLIPTQLVSKVEFHKTNQALEDKVYVLNSGNTQLAVGSLVNMSQVQMENKMMKSNGLRPAEVRPAQAAIGKLRAQGISASAITGDSFLAAASFQETTKVLLQAAVAKRVDKLLGIKENVLMGSLIPSGTGMRKYKDLRVISKEVRKSLTEEQQSQ